MPSTAKSATQRPTLSLRERNRRRTRREILDAALEVFAESGYGSATVENIAARAGTAKATLYSYFPQGREELLRQLYEEINNELIEKVTLVYASNGTVFDRVVATTEVVLDIAQRPLVGRFYSIDDPALDAALTVVRGHASCGFADLLTADLGAAQDVGAIRSTAQPAAIAGLLLGAMRSALTQVACEAAQPRDVVQAMKALISTL